MIDILDNSNVIAQRDPEGALKIIASQFEQAKFNAKVWNSEHDNRAINSVVVTGMGGSALAALIAKVLLNSELKVSFEIIRGYDLPA
jgi:fructoselysine-6-P-deglycase FrlB-like protein